MTLFQIVAVAALAIVVGADIRGMLARRGRLLIRVGRVSMCIVAAILIMLPGLTSDVAATVGIGRGTDLLLYLMLLLSPLAWFQLQTQNASLERRLVQLARDEALRNPVRCVGD